MMDAPNPSTRVGMSSTAAPQRLQTWVSSATAGPKTAELLELFMVYLLTGVPISGRMARVAIVPPTGEEKKQLGFA